LGAQFGVDIGVLGALIGIGLIVLIVIVFAIFEAEGPILLLGVIAMAAVNVVLGFWPTWIITVLAIIGGVLVWQAIDSTGGKRG